MVSPAVCVSSPVLERTQRVAWLFYERASHSAATTLLQMQMVINNIINIFLQSMKNCTVNMGLWCDGVKSRK